ncbi:hypothetical protein PCANC_18023 [Puccinia coronata f. sp. avenae]|uniref:Uncharacterized protein n=1 Tax=Puccinia coronata f. sp. avenae TaxID=200324 RepID=A0A2N5SJ17_9BASI|nr:hypothetical protein PCANC_18023 [Puccinia coronata f. sp. avenae]
MPDDKGNDPPPQQVRDKHVEQLAAQVTGLRGDLSCLFPPSPTGTSPPTFHTTDGTPLPSQRVVFWRLGPTALLSSDNTQSPLPTGFLFRVGYAPDHLDLLPLWIWAKSSPAGKFHVSGSFNPYGDLNGIPFTIMALQLDVEEARIKQYISGLNPRIIAQAMSKEWRGANTLGARMDLATKAAAQLNLLSLLPCNTASHSWHRPLSLAPPPGLSFPPSQQAQLPQDPNAMEIDATAPTAPFTHTVSLDCPNPGVTWEQREAFVAKHKPNSSTFVAAVKVDSLPQSPSAPLTYCPPKASTVTFGEDSTEGQVDPEAPILGNFQGFDKNYAEFEEALCAVFDVPIATVHVRLDCSKKGQLIVPVLFKGPDGVWALANILVDTGAMANFFSEEFIRCHVLPLWSQKHPICCVGFDGKEEVGGLVTQDWAGVI